LFKTRVTKMLNIEYPILCGAMSFITRAELVAAVSNAGGFGILPSAHFETPQGLREEIRKTKNLTDKPFGVNINFFPSVKPLPTREFIEVIIEEKVKAVETSGHRDPGEYVPRLHEGGVLVVHKAATVRHCLRGQDVGADMVTIVGMENGGATGMEDVSTLVLLPVLASRATIPVIGGGGFADGRGLVAALALGAEGIIMGTRFLATKECPVHTRYKEWVTKATERDTVLVMRSIQNTHRALRSKVTDKLAGLEARGASLEELLPIIGGRLSQKAGLDGDLEAGMCLAGEAVGLINDVPTVKELFDHMIREANAVYERLGKMGIEGK
jgi:NADH:quinone reductase (non-electrogenic)